MSSNQKDNKASHSRNVTQDSQLSAGKNIRIGDANYYLNLNVSSWLILGLIVFVSVFYFYKNDISKRQIEAAKEIKKSESQNPDSLKSLSDPITSKKTEEKKGKKKARTKPLISKAINPKEATNLLLIEADSPLQFLLTSGMEKLLSQKNIRWISKSRQGQYQQQLHCRLRLQKDTVTLGMSSKIQVTFHLATTLIKTADKKILDSHSLSSGSFYISSEQQISQAFGQWVDESGEKILPQIFR